MTSLRAQPMEKLKMLNGNTQWVRGDTRRNIDTIYEWLEKKFEGKFLGNGHRTFTFRTIAKGTGINAHAVSTACKTLAYLKTPVVRLHARRLVSKEGVRTYHGVELIRRIPSEMPENKADGAPDHPTP